jgi:hypothetical protein
MPRGGKRPASGRPHEGRYIQLSVRVSAEARAALERLTRELDASQGSVVDLALLALGKGSP